MATSAQPQTKGSWVMDPAHTSIEFSAKHLVITTVRGRFEKFEVRPDFDPDHPEHSSVEVRIDASSISTREPKRDAHLKSPDFLDAEKSPYITFKSGRVQRKGGDRYELVGDLTIRDVTREVVLNTTFAGIAKDPMGNEHAGFSAETSLNRKDFGLNWNMALETGGVLVGDVIKIYIETELVKQK